MLSTGRTAVETRGLVRAPGVASPTRSAAALAGQHFALHKTEAGEISLAEIGEHRLKIHAGEPVRGSCRAQRFLYQRGDVDLFPAGMSDTWEELDPGSSLIVRIAPWFLRRAAEDMGRDAERTVLAPRHQFRDARIEHIAWALAEEHEGGPPGGRLYTESLGLALAAHLLGSDGSSERAPRGLTPRQRRQVVEHIEAQLAEELSLRELAALAGLSASHFKSQFKRALGVPVHEYVIRRRIERARTLLELGELSITQVALEVGFAHPSHMARCMRRLLGVTPSVLRRAR